MSSISDAWQKARASESGNCLEVRYQAAQASQGSNCLEVGYQKAAASAAGQSVEAGEGACGMIHVRDSHTPDVVVNCPPYDFSLFLKAVKGGEFDHLITT